MQLCGQPAVRQALNNVRTLNPLYAGVDGMVGVVVGNAVLIGGAIVLQVLSVVLLFTIAKWRRVAHIPTLVEASTTLRAPSVSIAVLFSLYQGTFYASTQVITQEGVDGGDAAIGSIAFCLLLAVPPFCVWWCTTAAARRDCFRYDYKASNVHVVLRGVVTSVVLLPHSKIDPPAVAFRFATLVANYCSPHSLVVVIPVVVPFGVSLISLWHPDGIGQCRVYFLLAIVMHVAMVCFVAILRPFRYLLNSVFFCLGYVINLALLVCMVIAIDCPRFLAADVVNGIGFAQLAFQILNSCFRVWSVFVDIFIINSEIPLVLLWSTHSSSNTLQAPTGASPPLDLDEIVDVVEVSHYFPHSPNTSADDGFLCLPNWEMDDARELQVTEPRSFDDALSGVLLPPLPSALHFATPSINPGVLLPPSTPPPSSQHLDFSFLNSLNHTSRVSRRIGDTSQLATDLEVGLSRVAAWNVNAAKAF